MADRPPAVPPARPLWQEHFERWLDLHPQMRLATSGQQLDAYLVAGDGYRARPAVSAEPAAPPSA